MNKTLVVAGGAVVAIAAVAVILAASRGDSPIEVADSSIDLYSNNGFEVQAGNRLKASKSFHRVLQIEVWNRPKDANPPAPPTLYETIDVKGRDWTIKSVDETVTVQKSAGTFTDGVPILGPANSTFQPVIPGDTVRFRYNSGNQFTPATLSFTDGEHPLCQNPKSPTACTLTCPAHYCAVVLQYR